MPAHTHLEKTGFGSGSTSGVVANASLPSAHSDSAYSTAANTAADASSAHNNMQPYLLLNFIIKT